MMEQTGLQNQQNELLSELTNRLGQVLPPSGWQQLVIDYQQVGRHIQISVGLILPDNTVHHWQPPEDAVAYFQVLRDRMYTRGQGTWFSTRFTIDYPNTFNIQYNYRAQPNWGNAAAEEFAVDLERYPREDQYIPDWFRARLGGGAW